MAGYIPADPADPDRELLFATILRRRRGWQVMWIGGRANLGDLRDFRAPVLMDAATEATRLAAEFFRSKPARPDSEFLLWIYGRRMPVNAGPQLIVTGKPGQFTALNARDESQEFHGATLDDLLVAVGVNPAEPADWWLSWAQPVSALLAH